jgi:OOP family OmpA-OmpF porin
MKKIAIAIMLSAFVAAPAVAADLYAGVKLGSVNYGYGNVTNNDQIGFGLLGGFAFNENFAVEAEYTSLGGFDSPQGTIKGSSFGVSGIGSVPLNQQFSLFGKLGIASTSLKDSPKPGYVGVYTYNYSGLTVGVGGQYNVSPVVGIRVGFDWYKVGDSVSGTSSANMMYVGGVFKF